MTVMYFWNNPTPVFGMVTGTEGDNMKVNVRPHLSALKWDMECATIGKCNKRAKF